MNSENPNLIASWSEMENRSIDWSHPLFSLSSFCIFYMEKGSSIFSLDPEGLLLLSSHMSPPLKQHENNKKTTIFCQKACNKVHHKSLLRKTLQMGGKIFLLSCLHIMPSAQQIVTGKKT